MLNSFFAQNFYFLGFTQIKPFIFKREKVFATEKPKNRVKKNANIYAREKREKMSGEKRHLDDFQVEK